MNKEELRVITSGSAEENYEYALNHRWCNVKAHGKVVINSGDVKYNYYFAKDIKGADIKAHGQAIIDSGRVLYNYYFADIKGADIQAHGQVVIDSCDAKYNYHFAREIQGADIQAHGQAVIDSGDAHWNYEFAKNIKGADIKGHGQAVIDSCDVEYNYEFARDIQGADIQAHRKVIAKYGSKEELARFDRKFKELSPDFDYDKEENDNNREKESIKKKKKNSNPYQFEYKELNNDELLSSYVKADMSVFLHGPSGVGKSARVKQLDPTATRITLRPQMNPEEVDGTLNRETGEYIPPLWYTQLCEKCESEPDKKHILFIDELTNVKPTVQSLVYSIVLDRAGKDGLWPLPKNAVVVAAGNESKDNLAAYPLTNALFRRFNHLYYEVDKEDWLEWATRTNSGSEGMKIHPLIIEYIMNREGILNQELDEENPKIVTDPRKWEMASNVLYATNNPNALLPLIGEELTADFKNFVKQNQLTPQKFKYKELNNDELLNSLVEANVSIFLHGPSGVGKSARVKQLDPTATRITLRPQMNPEEVDGTLNRETGGYIPPLWYTQLCEKCESEPDRKHILFIDELTNVKPTVQSLVYSIVLDRAGKDGLWPLPENAVVVAAGNESKDNLAAYPLTNALFRRFNHIYYEVDKEDWLSWATKVNSSMEGKKIHPAIIAYIMSKKDVLNQELDEENPKIVTDPRKWEMASKVLYMTNNPYALLPAVGEELTADFVDFVQQIQITPQDIVSGNYDEEDFKELNISQKLSTIAGLTIAQESELALVREFIKDNLGKEQLATFDTLWIGNDPERAMIIGELRENKNNEKSLNK